MKRTPRIPIDGLWCVDILWCDAHQGWYVGRPDWSKRRHWDAQAASEAICKARGLSPADVQIERLSGDRHRVHRLRPESCQLEVA